VYFVLVGGICPNSDSGSEVLTGSLFLTGRSKCAARSGHSEHGPEAHPLPVSGQQGRGRAGAWGFCASCFARRPASRDPLHPAH
jgi:hypothetical protein